VSILELILSLVAILAAAVFFTNAVEILGGRMNLGQGSVGSVLAAVGTALPETMIPVVAIAGALFLGRDPQSAGDIGIGAILGAPFLLATLALFVVGASAIGFRRRRENGTELVVDREVTARDMAFFLVFFTIASGAGIVTLPIYVKVALAVVLVGAYAYYVGRTIKSGGESEGEEPKRLILWSSRSEPPTWAVVAELVGFVTVMVVGAHFFVTAIEHLSKEVGIPAGLIALVLAPLATELPEKFNSIIWVRDGKDTLAFGNISGAMVFQSTIPVTLGLLFTKWQLNSLSVFAVGLALASGVVFYLLLRSKRPMKGPYLLLGGVMYAAFVVAAVLTVLL
jgi:cation:H+ antiporter